MLPFIHALLSNFELTVDWCEKLDENFALSKIRKQNDLMQDILANDINKRSC
jgi:hypothetical protein